MRYYIESIFYIFYIHDPKLHNSILYSIIELGCCVRPTNNKVGDTTYLHQERHGERCDTTIHVGIEFLGHSMYSLRAACHGARLCWITAQVLQAKDLSKYYRRGLIGASKWELLSTE